MLIAFVVMVVGSVARDLWPGRIDLSGLLSGLIVFVVVGSIYGGFGWAIVRYHRKHFGRAGPPPGRPSACVACEDPLDAAMERCPECGRPVETVVVKGPESGEPVRTVVKSIKKS